MGKPLLHPLTASVTGELDPRKRTDGTETKCVSKLRYAVLN